MINKRQLLHLVGCLHRCCNDARSHKRQSPEYSYSVGTVRFDVVTELMFDVWLTVHRNSVWIRKAN